MRHLTLALVALVAGWCLAWISRPNLRPAMSDMAAEVAWFLPYSWTCPWHLTR